MQSKWHLSYARGYLELGLIAEAAAELSKMSTGDLNSTEALSIRAQLYQEQRNWAEACEISAELCRREPENASWWIMFAYSTRRAGSLNAAEAILLAAEKIHPDEPTILFNLGCYACQRGDIGLAARRVRRATEIDASFQELIETDPDLEALRAAR